MANLTYARLSANVKRCIGNRDDLNSEVQEAIDQAYLRAACTRGVTFHELDTLPATFNTASGTRRYNFDTTILAAGSGRNILAVFSPIRDTTNKRPIHAHSVGHFDMMDQSGTGKPVWFAHWGNSLEFHPTPDGTYAMQIRYRLRPTKLAGAGSIVLPEEWDWVVIWEAAFILNAEIGNLQKAAFYRDMRAEMVRSLVTTPEVEDEYLDMALAPDLRR